MSSGVMELARHKTPPTPPGGDEDTRIIPVPGKKQYRFEVRLEEEWYARVLRQANRYGLSVGAYMRQAAQVRLEQDEATDPSLR